jgi:hypothetical protein
MQSAEQALFLVPQRDSLLYSSLCRVGKLAPQDSLCWTWDQLISCVAVAVALLCVVLRVGGRLYLLTVGRVLHNVLNS